MSKIEDLTPEQLSAMLQFRDEWLDIATASGKADIDAIRESIAYFYRKVGATLPPIVRVPSPMSAHYLINVLMYLDRQGHAIEQGHQISSTNGKLEASLADMLFGNITPYIAAIAPVIRQIVPACQFMDDLGVADLVNRIPEDDWEFSSTSLWGSLDSYWIAFYLFPHLHLRPMHSDEEMRDLNHWANIARNAFWWYPFDTICIVVDRPTQIHLDDQQRFHNESVASLQFGDGWSIYALDGMMLDEKIVARPHEITVDEIDAEVNVEIRRVMISRLGEGRFIEKSDATMVDETEDGAGNMLQLYRRIMPNDEPMVMIRKVDSSTGGVYFERVPPNIQTCIEALEWQWELEPGEYMPDIQT